MAITITGKGQTTYGPSAILGDDLLLHMDPGNPKSVCSSNSQVLYDLTDKGIVYRGQLNTTDPVYWSSGCFTTVDEISPTTVHYIPGDVGYCGSYSYLGFRLYGKYVLNHTTWDVSLTLNVISGFTYLFMGSAGGGYMEGQYLYYPVGTYNIVRTFYVGNSYYELHEASPLEFCSIAPYTSEVRITNLDVRERGNDVVIFGGASIGGNVVSLDGPTNGYIGAAFRANDFFFNDSPFSLSIWVKPTAHITTNGGLICNQNYYTESNPGGFGMVIYDTNKVALTLTKNITGDTVTYETIANQTLTKDVWQHIVYTYDPVSHTVCGYKNGFTGNTSTNASYCWTPQFRNTLIGTNTQGGWGNCHSMNIGPVKIFKKALTASEVFQDYNAIKGRFGIVNYEPIVTDGLVLYLDSMDSRSYPKSGTMWYDISGYDNHGTLHTFSGAGPGATSGYDSNTGYMMFDRHVGGADSALNNYVSFSDSATLDNCYSENGVSIEFWLKVTTQVCTAIGKMGLAWEIYYCSLLTHRTVGTGGNDGASSVSFNTYYPNMHHIIATHNGTNRRLYVNGGIVLDDINSVTGQSFNSLALGAYDGGQFAFVGAIPVFKLYNRALDSSEVQQNYNALKGRFGL